MTADLPQEKRNKSRPIKVLVTTAERQVIERGALAAAMPPSSYLRVLGLGHEPKSRLDQQALLSLLKVNADQGRLGGLLKLWLSTRAGHGAPVGDVRKLLKQIEETQLMLRAFVDRL